MRCPPRVTSRQLDTSRGNKPRNKENDEDNDKNVKQAAGDISTRTPLAEA